MARLTAEGAVSLPLLGPALCRRLVTAARRLPYRRAVPVIGEGARAVRQDFDLCYTIPPASPFHAIAAALERHIDQALGHLDPAPLEAPFHINDIIVQRYARGALGITPHRDHVRYEGLVVVIPLGGAARFLVCAERTGNGAREVPAPPGSAVIMRAPGFAGSRARPFHFVTDVTRQRFSLGLRHDVRRPSGP